MKRHFRTEELQDLTWPNVLVGRVDDEGRKREDGDEVEEVKGLGPSQGDPAAEDRFLQPEGENHGHVGIWSENRSDH